MKTNESFLVSGCKVVCEVPKELQTLMIVHHQGQILVLSRLRCNHDLHRDSDMQDYQNESLTQAELFRYQMSAIVGLSKVFLGKLFRKYASVSA
jgi:hypothetical protein